MCRPPRSPDRPTPTTNCNCNCTRNHSSAQRHTKTTQPTTTTTQRRRAHTAFVAAVALALALLLSMHCLQLRATASAARAAAPVLRPRAAVRRGAVRAFGLFDSLFGGGGKQQQAAATATATATMGAGSSKQPGGREGWAPAAPGDAAARRVSKAGFDITPLTAEERAAAAAKLTDFQRYVTLEQGTERAFTGKTADGLPWDHSAKGTYVDAISGLPLFATDAKFNSGTGWPSFYQPVSPDHVIEVRDTSIPWMPRVEVICAKSGAHLGHVFDDGPRPTGKRFCINAAALKFVPAGEPLPLKVEE